MPEGTTQAELQRRLELSRLNLPGPSAETTARIRTQRPPVEREAAETALGAARETESPRLAGFGKSFLDLGSSLEQLAAQSINPNVAQLPEGTRERLRSLQSTELQRIQKEIDQRQELFDRLLKAQPEAGTGELAGDIAQGIVIPGGAAQQVGRRTLGALGAGAVQEGLLEPGTPQERLGRAVTGGALGGAIGGLGGGTGRALRGGPEASQRAQQLAQDARRLEINPPLTVGELRGSTGIQRFERFLENFPVIGTNRVRSTQQRNLEGAALRLRNQFPESSTEDIEGSFLRVMERGKKKAEQAFNRVERLSRNTQERVLPLNRRSVAQGLLSDEIGKGVDANADVIRFLQRSIQSGPVDFKTARSIRSDLLKDARNARARAQRNEATNIEASIRDRVNEAFERDIEEFATRAGGGILEEFRRANRLFVEGVLPFQKDRVLRQLGDTDTDTVISSFIKKGRPRLARKLSSKLDERGNQALKFVIMDDAFEAATRDGVFKPQTFATKLESLRQTTEAVFSPEESVQLGGFVRLANAAQRAGRDANILGSGLGVGGLGAAGLISDTGTAGAAAGGIFVLSNLLITGAGRRLLTRANKGINPPLIDAAFKLAGEIAEKTAQRTASEQSERVIGAL